MYPRLARPTARHSPELAVAIVPLAAAAPAPLAGLGEIVTLAPAGSVSTARRSDGRYSKSAEAKRKAAHAQLCADLKLIRELALEQYAASGSGDEFNTALKSRDDARKQGCGWAQ